MITVRNPSLDFTTVDSIREIGTNIKANSLVFFIIIVCPFNYKSWPYIGPHN